MNGNDSVKRLFRLFQIAIVAALAGCALLKPTPDNVRYYILTSSSKMAAAETARPRLVVRLQPVEVARYLQGGDIAVRAGANEIIYPLNDRWAEPLDAGVRRVLAENLRALPTIGDVLTDQPAPPGQPVHAIFVRVTACEGVQKNARAGAIAFEASWQITSGTSESVLAHGIFKAGPEAWTPGNYAQLADHIGRALRDFSGVLADALAGK